MSKLLATEEYLARERRAEFKSEYFKGETFAMAGASRPHNQSDRDKCDCDFEPTAIAARMQRVSPRHALQRYSQTTLLDQEASFEIRPDEEFPDMFIGPIIVSSRFNKKPETARQDSVLEFLSHNANLTNDDMSVISHIITREE